MITDEMLRKAAEEAALSINDSLPAPEECHHDFSPEFEKKLRKLEKKVKHPVFYKAMQAAACFLLVVSIGFTSVLVFSSEARAVVFGWFRSVCESFYEYSFAGDSAGIEAVQYQMQWVPDGYTLTSRETIDGNTDAWYENEAGDSILFGCTDADSDTSLYIEVEGAVHHTANINGNMADLYLDEAPTGRQVIVWIDPKTETLLFINGHLTEEELIRMAESVVIE